MFFSLAVLFFVLYLVQGFKYIILLLKMFRKDFRGLTKEVGKTSGEQSPKTLNSLLV